MLRNIIAAYRAVFLIGCALALALVILFGLFMFVEADSSGQRWTAMGGILSGALFVIFVAGNFALSLENNDLLRQIVENTAQDKGGEINQTYRDALRYSSSTGRREPTI